MVELSSTKYDLKSRERERRESERESGASDEVEGSKLSLRSKLAFVV